MYVKTFFIPKPHPKKIIFYLIKIIFTCSITTNCRQIIFFILGAVRVKYCLNQVQ